MSAPDRGEAPDAGRRHLEDLLDEALEETFPASDPPAVGVEDPLPPPAAAPPEDAGAGSRGEQHPGGRISTQPAQP
jgi:hypothetical protein